MKTHSTATGINRTPECALLDPSWEAGRRAARYDLIILDINLPGTDGLQAFQRLQLNVNTASIPILLLTGDTRKFTVLQGRKLGARDFMAKPIDPLLLEERVIQQLADE